MPGPLNLALIEEQLSREPLAPVGALSWLKESYRDPEAFWQSLKLSHDGILPMAGKSVPWSGYDFYHDIVARNAANASPALRWLDPAVGWREISYTALGRLAGAKEATWRRIGVKPGEILCIVMPLGLEYVTTLLAALKMGLIVSVLPPMGRRFLGTRLEALGPDRIAAGALYLPLLGAWRDRVLQEDVSAQKADNGMERSHTYPSGSIAALCFDPSGESPHVPSALTADTLYLCAMRDGLAALGLRPSRMIAAPGFHFPATQPFLILSTFLAGATFVHMEADDVAREPRLLADQPITVLGVSRGVRDILIEKPVEVARRWRFWFRDPAESRDLALWHTFVHTMQLDDVPVGNLRWRTALGGCFLFSVRRKGLPHANVLPSAGAPWELGQVSDGDGGSLWSYGIFTPSLLAPGGGEGVSSNEMIAGSRDEWLYMGSPLPVRSGRTYPKGEVLGVIRDLPHGALSSIVEIPPSGGEVGDHRFALALFTQGKTQLDEAALSGVMKSAIEREMGREFLPDYIRIFPLFPRLAEGGEVDHEWCRSQYITGRLFRKSRQEVFVCLAKLRQCLTSSGDKAVSG
jgi:hypothetical protein